MEIIIVGHTPAAPAARTAATTNTVAALTAGAAAASAGGELSHCTSLDFTLFVVL